MLTGVGNATTTLTDAQVAEVLAQALAALPLDGKRVLAIIPDGTRTAPMPLIYRLLQEQIGALVARLDFVIALGTHALMSDAAIDRLVGMPAAERAVRFPNSRVFNHRWDVPETLTPIGTIAPAEMLRLTDGLLDREVTIRINRAVLEYDHILICGPVFPHEVVGFSGGAKYLFPGIAAGDIIHATHWLGALATSMATIGIKETPVRRVIHRAAEFVRTPISCLAMVLHGSDLHGVYIGEHQEAWSAAADLSAQLNILYTPQPYRQVLSMPASRYEDLWTAAKAMYKTEPAIADGGEVIIYAPNISEFSYSHGPQIEEVGFHVRDYFVQQWDRFGKVPGAILAHSTHVKGAGTYDAASGVETPRIQVTLATSISEARCRNANLGFADYRAINPQEWEGRESDGILLVRHAGEMLYRVQR